MIRLHRTSESTKGFGRSLASGACVLALPSGLCAQSVEGSETRQEPAIVAPDMDAFWAAHAAHRQSGDVEAAASILAEDCVLFEPFRPPVSGLAKITAKIKKALSMAEIHEVFFDSREVYHHGRWLVDLGTFSETFSETFSLAGDEDRHVVEGNYTAVLERDADGNWKVKRFMAMPSSPPPG